MGNREKPNRMPTCSHAGNSGTDGEGIWADPEAILRPTAGERLRSIIQEFEDDRYPQMMALGWTKLALERLPQNQIEDSLKLIHEFEKAKNVSQLTHLLS